MAFLSLKSTNKFHQFQGLNIESLVYITPSNPPVDVDVALPFSKVLSMVEEKETYEASVKSYNLLNQWQ